MNMREYSRLKAYLAEANHVVHHEGFHAISIDDFKMMIRRLVQFERPDMYAELDDKIIILEHFEFDASRNTKKGMKGKAEEAHLERLIQNSPSDGIFRIEKAEYEISFRDWQENFENTFCAHCDRIDAYKERVAQEVKNREKPFIIGFFIEHLFSPYANIGSNLHELQYCETQQFADALLANPKVDFVLFCGYQGGKMRNTYFDRQTLNAIRNKLFDLNDKKISLSHINGNDVVAYGGIEILREDIENA